MMYATGEHTPLLKRTRPQHIDTGAHRRRSGLDNDAGSDNDNGNDVESIFSPSVQEFDKDDRRSVLQRIGQTITNNIRATSYRVLPPMDDFTADRYEDTYNDQPWKCTFGTNEDDGIWINHYDRVGTVMAALVWVLILYSSLTVLILAQHQHVPVVLAAFYCTICALALASHAKTCFTDPGAVPVAAVPLVCVATNSIQSNSKEPKFYAMCSHCQTYKPDGAHHCRICDRCVSRMDHHCPWMNNCVGAANMKHFTLFLVYVWTASALALVLFSINYFFCTNEYCEFSGMEVQLVRAMTWICIGALLFTTSMLMSLVYSLYTGIGTVDRLKKKATNAWHETTEEPVPWRDIFGIAPVWTWPFPVYPIFDDYDRIMGYATPQRLLRAQSLYKNKQAQQQRQQQPQPQQQQQQQPSMGRIQPKREQWNGPIEI
jgi:hypothetical protein